MAGFRRVASTGAFSALPSAACVTGCDFDSDQLCGWERAGEGEASWELWAGNGPEGLGPKDDFSRPGGESLPSKGKQVEQTETVSSLEQGHLSYVLLSVKCLGHRRSTGTGRFWRSLPRVGFL